MKSQDSAGFIYDAVFGCSRKLKYCMPHILVRVELRATADHDHYRFLTFVDYQLMNGADIELAEHFYKAIKQATKKMRWATNLVDGKIWHREDVF